MIYITEQVLFLSVHRDIPDQDSSIDEDMQTTGSSIMFIKTWLSTLETVYNRSLCLSDETLKAVGPFHLVSMPGEVKYPTQGVNVYLVVDSTF